MDNNDKKAFADTLGALQVAFGAKADDSTRNAYWTLLNDLTLPQFKRAALEAGRTLKFFPKPAELREMAGAGPAVAAANAWEAVYAAMNQHDSYESVDFGDLVNAVVRNLGGSINLCEKSLPDLVWVRKDFERIYGDFSRLDPTALHGRPLLGSRRTDPIRIAIGGEMPPHRVELPAGDSSVRGLIRDMADKLSDDAMDLARGVTK